MDATRAADRTPPTERTLRDAGFSEEGIERLTELRRVYPWLETTETDSEWKRLCFFRWLHQTERITG